MQKDLFGNPIKKRRTRLEIQLSKHDRETFEDRLERLKYLDSVIPKNYWMAGSFESIFLFQEAGVAFINGAFISSIILAQAFVERRLQDYMEARGLSKEARRGLDFIIKYFRKNRILDEFLLRKIDVLRQKRNPFSHLKPYDHPYTLSQRIFLERKQPDQILLSDAKEAVSLMYKISLIQL